MEEPSSTSTATATSTSSPSSSSQRLQGPRPASLRVRRDSHRIRKPPVQQVRQPVIIYTVSPKVVHAQPSEFRSVVQRLTGAAPSSSSSLPPPPPPPVDTMTQYPFPFFVPSSSFPPPPAPHIDVAAPPLPFPSSILSPVPGSLPAVPPSFFSPPSAGAAGGGINLSGELVSPAFLGGASQIYPSPSGAYYWDLFNNQHNL